MSTRPLGRRVPRDWKHVERHPFTTVAPRTVASVNKWLLLPLWHWYHDQGYEGSCVGHGVVMERAITNNRQNVLMRMFEPKRRYDPISVWDWAKSIDEWADTNPGDDEGTSVRAGYDTTRLKGLRRVSSMRLVNGVPTPVDLQPWNTAEGISTNRWAQTVDEIRTAIALNLSVVIGVNWYENFDRPVNKGRFAKQWWIGEGALGNVRGGHALVIYGASDSKQAFKLKNSWGRDYPLVWMPYTTMQRLIGEYGEMALVTDR